MLMYADVDPDKPGACMFQSTCRLNHHCIPNVSWTFDAKNQNIYTRCSSVAPHSFQLSFQVAPRQRVPAMSHKRYSLSLALSRARAFSLSLSLSLTHRAIRDIEQGEELFVTYKRPEPDGHGQENVTLDLLNKKTHLYI